jgi:geranylgeranyl pyrophosphate synthase
MMTPSGENVCFPEAAGPALASVFHPISSDLQAMQELLAQTLQDASDPPVREIVEFLLAAPGKRLRPALALLAARAVCGTTNGSLEFRRACARVAAAVELIHMASLVHDDLIDAAAVRHGRSSIQAKWGKSVAVAVGDYLCARAFLLVARCANPRLFAVLGTQLSLMCEGELLQVVGRGNFRLSERCCLEMTERKTAALFGACCAAGALTAGPESPACRALQDFGFHFGVAFQILDDCRDLLSDQRGLGKAPGQDLRAGDVTLPLLYTIRPGRRRGAEPPAAHPSFGTRELARLGQAFRSSRASAKVAQLVDSHIRRAQQRLQSITDSVFKDSLRQLADQITISASCLLAR